MSISFSLIIRNTLRKNLKMFSYQTPFMQQLIPEDYPLQMDFAQLFRLELDNYAG